jgi:hypothetical protein
MSKLRDSVRARLTPEQLELETWVHEVQQVDGDPRVPAGMIARCLVIASLRPDWSYFEVLSVCRKTCLAKIQLPELVRIVEQVERLT